MGQSGIGVRPNVSGLGSRINVPGVGTRLNLSGAGAGGSTNLGARTFAGRVTSGQINNHLSLGARQGALGQGNLGQINRGQGILGLNGGIRASSGANLKASLPNWVNVRSSQIGRVNNNLGAALRSPAVRNQGLNNWLVNNPARATHWNNWAGNVRGGWRPNWYHGYFNNHFWAIHASPYAWRRGAYWWGHRPWGYWWGVPTWGAYQAWWPQGGRSSPCYYDYGPGGNVVYSSGYVYVSGQPVGTVADYAASAVALADVPEPANPDQATEWLPLGTFALATSQEDRDPTRIIQLAVDREGIISGTYLNRETDKTYSVQGRVDRQTQRVAFTIGDNRDAVFETGIYNLTQAETPILIHDGPDQTETYLLIRLEAPKETEPRPPAPGDAGLLP